MSQKVTKSHKKTKKVNIVLRPGGKRMTRRKPKYDKNWLEDLFERKLAQKDNIKKSGNSVVLI